MSIVTGLPALPALTTDLDQARADLDELGIARIEHALGDDELTALNTRLTEQATAEREAGLAFIDGGGANQRVWNLPSKGAEFVDLLRKPLVRELARHILQGDYCLSSHTANIAGPGGAPMVLHSDQGYTPAGDRPAADDERDVDARRLHRRERGHAAGPRLPPAAGRAAPRRAVETCPASVPPARRSCSTAACGTARVPTRRRTGTAPAC